MYNKIRLGYHTPNITLYPSTEHTCYPSSSSSSSSSSSHFTNEKNEKKNEKNIRTNRAVLLNENFPEKIIPEAVKLARLNLADALEILKWNEKKGIRFFRLNSEIFPQISNWRLFRDKLKP